MKLKSKNVMVALAVGLAALPVNAQDRGLYYQNVHLTDGSKEEMLLSDNYSTSMRIIKADDWEKMTIAEYLHYNTSLGADSASTYIWGSGLLNGGGYLDNFWVPTNKAWTEERQRRLPYYNSVGKINYFTQYDFDLTRPTLYSAQTSCTDLASLAIVNMGITMPTPQTVLSRQQVSNGVVTVVDEVPYEEFVKEKELAFTPDRCYYTRSYWDNATQSMRDTTIFDPVGLYVVEPGHLRDSLDVANGTSFVTIEPDSRFSKPQINLLLPQTLSTTYNIYCVLAPESPAFDETVETAKRNRIIFTLHYSDVDGKMKQHEFLDESEENIAAFQEEFNLADNSTSRTTIRAFSNDTTKVDTLFVGQFTFPVCYEGAVNNNGDIIDPAPVLSISSPYSVFNSKMTNAFTSSIRLAAILLRPVELENKQ